MIRPSRELKPTISNEPWRSRLLVHSHEIVVLVDRHGRLRYASPSTARWLGHPPCDLVGGEVADITHEDDRAALVRAIHECQPARPVSLIHRVRSRDGSWRRLDSTIAYLGQSPKIGTVLITSRDVTEQYALEHERERLDMERRVSQHLQAVGQLAAGIAHEINTPLQFVGDSLSFLEEAVNELVALTTEYRDALYTDAPIPLPQRRATMRAAEERADVDYLCERAPAALNRAADGVARVRSIVVAMKRFSHPSTIEGVAADINEGIETTLAVCRNEYKYIADVTVELNHLPPVACNIGELNQVFLNLIINAAQAIGDKVAGTGDRGQITIVTRHEEPEVIIEVADDGAGIPLELQDRIYEPFFTTKPVGQGTGQGLALARTTVERHRGSLECRSVPGCGTTFSIRLPTCRNGDGHGSEVAE